MKHLENHIYRIISDSGYYYSVRSHPQMEGTTIFVVNGMRSGITTHIIVCDKFNYVSFISFGSYSIDRIDDLTEALNSLNIMAPLNTKYFYRSHNSSLYSLFSLFVSGSFPDKALVMDALMFNLNSLVNGKKKLDEYKTGTWKPTSEMRKNLAGEYMLYSRQEMLFDSIKLR